MIVVTYATWGTLLAIDKSTSRSNPTTIWYRVLEESPMKRPHTKAVLIKGGTATSSFDAPPAKCLLKVVIMNFDFDKYIEYLNIMNELANPCPINPQAEPTMEYWRPL